MNVQSPTCVSSEGVEGEEIEIAVLSIFEIEIDEGTDP